MLPTDIRDALDGYVRLVRAADGHAYNGNRQLAQEWDEQADKARDELELRILNAINPELTRD